MLPFQEPGQSLFVLRRRHQLLPDELPPPGGHQHKDVVGRGPKFQGQFVYGREFGPVGPGDGGVDLKGEPGLSAGGDAAQGPGIGPFTARRRSWEAALAPSMEMDSRWMPASLRRAAMAGVKSVPFTAMTMRWPRWVP